MQEETLESVADKDTLPDMMVRLTLSLCAGKDFDKNLTRVLRLIGEYSHHDRIHIIEIHENMTYSVPYEWHAAHLSPFPEQRGRLPLIHDRLLQEQLCRNDCICVMSSDKHLPEELHAFLLQQSCCQMLLLPLFESGSQFAFIAYLQCGEAHPWGEREMRILRDFASLIATQMHAHLRAGRLSALLKRHREVVRLHRIYHKHLKELNTQMVPAWKALQPAIRAVAVVSEDSVARIDKQMDLLDKICRTYL